MKNKKVYRQIYWICTNLREVIDRKWLMKCLAWCGSNKMPSLSLKRHRCGSGYVKAGLHNSESWKVQIININLPQAHKSLISFWYGYFIVAWNKIWNDNYLFEVELLQHFLQLRKLALAARKAFAGRMLPAGRMLCRSALKVAVPMVFGSALTLETFVLVVVVARFNSWDHFFFAF